jgi:transposase InsO family protein
MFKIPAKMLVFFDQMSTNVLLGSLTGQLGAGFRDECLTLAWFRSRREAKIIIETWRRHYNAVRPHSSLDYRAHHKSANQGAVLK